MLEMFGCFSLAPIIYQATSFLFKAKNGCEVTLGFHPQAQKLEPSYTV